MTHSTHPAYFTQSFEIKVQLHAGMLDVVGDTVLQSLADLGVRFPSNARVRTARKYLLTGALTEKQVNRIARELVCNELIETFTVRKFPAGKGVRK